MHCIFVPPQNMQQEFFFAGICHMIKSIDIIYACVPPYMN
jgi:hypothetical protein